MIIPAAAPISSGAEETETTPRIMEKLDRGLVAAKVTNGVYLSWRLLGTESLSDQAFDIYRNDVKIHTTGVHDATCYTDNSGKVTDTYKVVRAGTTATEETAVTPTNTNIAYSAGGSLPYSNSVSYIDLKFDAPEGGTTPDGNEYTYTANDMSVGDLDGDGQYELVVKWDPSNAQDNSNSGYTGNVIIDAYEMNEVDADGKAVRLWRLDLGRNIRAGAHYTQYLVYDFDCDGKSEIIFKTAPNSKDANGDYVSKVGKGITVVNDETADYRNSGGHVITGEEYLTIFNGETGAAMQTVPYEPPRTIVPITNSGWGDSYGNRCERYLAGVAYLDGVRPSAIFTRGYYTYAYAAAYSWDGKNLNLQWLSKNDKSSCTVEYANGTTKMQSGKTLYGQGAHSVSVADVDNDGCDELIFGSAVLDNDGTVLIYDGRGHGDAEHVSDFDNDGKQEIFFVHEAGKGSDVTIDFAVDIKRYDNAAASGAYDVMLQPAVGDIARGVMANIDDEYAYENKSDSKNLAAFWSSADGTNLYNESGEVIGKIPNSNNNLFENMFVYWDGDLGRELLDGAMLAKKSIKNDTTARLYYNNSNSSFPNISVNNSTKSNPGLVADIFGDWREEIIYRLSDGMGARIYFSTIPTTYRLTTLMHDSQYRVAVAWQNVGYNQPAHQSYYIGSAALATDNSGALLNYLAPATQFTVMTHPGEEELPAPVPQKTNTKEITASKYRNEIGKSVDTTKLSGGDVWLNSYSDYWGTAYFGFSGISDFDPADIESATVAFTVDSYSVGNKKNRQFYFDLHYAGNDWEPGIVTVTKNPHPASSSLISQTNCHTNYDAGDVLLPGVAKEFDVTDYLRTLDKGTTDISFVAAVSGDGGSGAGAASILMASNPVLTIVTTDAVSLSGITASTTKTTYKEGDEFDKSTVSVTAHYSDGTDEELTPYYFSVTGYDKNVTGNQTLTVHVGDYTDTITIYVEPKQVTSLTLGGSYKTRYNYGEELNLTGMTVTANYDIGTSETVTDYTVSGYDKSKVGSQIITVSYGGKTAQLTVTVIRTDVYIDASKSGTTVTAELKNYTGSAQLILAVYDGTRLKSVDIKNASGAVSFTNVTVPTGGKYRIYAWDSAAGTKSLCAVYE